MASNARGKGQSVRNSRKRDRTLIDVGLDALRFTIKLFCGLLFGQLIWIAVIRPYGRFFDSGPTGWWWWLAAIFSLAVAVLFSLSMASRATIVLFLPSVMGSATQNYIIVLLFSALIGQPLANIAYNSVESVRVIGCSLTLTFDQLRERAKLVLNPIVEILADQGQRDMDSLRRELVRIQHMVAEIGRSARLSVADDGRPASPFPVDLRAALDERTQREVADSASSTSALISSTAPPSRPPGGAAAERVDRAMTQQRTPVEFEWDLENFGVRANVDINRVRALARQGKLALARYGLAGGNESVAQVNLTDILYASCVDVFRSAKRQCVESVEEMQTSCKDTIGPYLATIWCSPVTYSLESFCPWLMNQLVDEHSLCKQVKIVDWAVASGGGVGGGGGDKKTSAKGDGPGRSAGRNQQQALLPVIDVANRSMDVNEAFRELHRQMDRLSDNILLDRTTAGGGGGGGSMPINRLEISLTFNERTRKLFAQTKQLVEFITDKYRMRKLLVDALLFAYDIYTTYTFLVIMGLALRYRRDYLTDIKFDNCYITSDFRQLDASYARQRESASLSRTAALESELQRRSLDVVASAAEPQLEAESEAMARPAAAAAADDEDDERPDTSASSNNDIDNARGGAQRSLADSVALDSNVLPLTRDESEHYISAFTCKRRTSEERHVQQVSCSMALVFLAFTLSLLYLDDIFHALLVSIQDHSLIRFKELGYHELEVRVQGDGAIGRLVKRLVRNLSSIYTLDRYTSTRACLPQARATPNWFYLEFGAYVGAYLAIDQIGIYAMRLRRLTCAYFYPQHEQLRLRYLHHYIRLQRRRCAAAGLKDYLAAADAADAADDDEAANSDGNQSEQRAASPGADDETYGGVRRRADGNRDYNNSDLNKNKRNKGEQKGEDGHGGRSKSSATRAPHVDKRHYYTLSDALTYLSRCVCQSARGCLCLEYLFSRRRKSRL